MIVSGAGPARNRAVYGRAYWRHLANTVELFCMVALRLSGSATMGDDAACSQITLGNLVFSRLENTLCSRTISTT